MWWIVGVGAALVAAALAAIRSRGVRSRVNDGYRGLRRSLRALPLLPAVCLAVTGGVAIVLVATWILRDLIHTNAKAADPIDITKLSFTVAAGVGAAVALVVAYRRQRDIEQGRFVERFGAAAAQLGDHDVAVRIAGVYAMAGVADESTGLRRQQCVDVLCGYLRLPYSSEFGSNHQSKLVLTEPRTGDDGSPLGQQERHLEYRQNDKEVRATIVRIIADHLRDHEYSWSTCDFDFRTAHLEDVDFRHGVFGGTTRFDEATFSINAWFGWATFSGDARFDEATFSGDARFDEAMFSGDARFDEATFSGAAQFGGAAFSGAAQFGGAAFSGDAWFHGARFSGFARFEGARFSGDARFDKATFSGYSWFSGDAWFSGATFSEAMFSGNARFAGTTFSRDARFNKATFSGDARFGGARFSGLAWFGTARFSRDARFNDATFSGDADFNAVTFSGPASFAGTDFGRGTISFDNPRQWGPPAPTFDWDASTKPENVTPRSWPPTT
jgi:uncharacterized protein YjbI with pentapeptide repeats